MDGSANSAAAGHDRLGRFVNGHNDEYAARRRRVAERLREFMPLHLTAHKQLVTETA